MPLGPRQEDGWITIVDPCHGFASSVITRLLLALAIAVSLEACSAGTPFTGDPRLLRRGEQDGKWGFVDSTGAFVIPPRYSEIANFSEGRAAAAGGRGW